MWQDEIFTYVYTRESYAHHFALDRTTDVHPPLFTVMLKAWIALFGESRAAMRALPALIGALSLPALFLIGRNWLGLRIAVLSCLFFAFYPFNVHYTREIRAYGAIAFCMMWALFFFLELVRDRSMSRRRTMAYAAGYVLCLALTFHFHYVSLLFMALFGAATFFLFLQNRDVRLFRLLATCLVLSALLCVPQSVHFLGYAMNEGASRNAWIARTNLQVFYEQSMTAIAFPTLAKPVIVAFYLLGAWRLWQRSLPLFTVAMTFIVLGPLLFAAAGLFKPIYLARSFLGALVLLPLLLGVAVGTMPRRWMVASLVLLAGLHLWALAPDYPRKRVPNSGEAIAQAMAGRTDEVVFFDAELAPQMAAFGVDATDWRRLPRDTASKHGAVIARHLETCRLSGGCPRTIVIVERRPFYVPEVGAEWSRMIDDLSGSYKVVSDRPVMGYRMVTFE